MTRGFIGGLSFMLLFGCSGVQQSIQLNEIWNRQGSSYEFCRSEQTKLRCVATSQDKYETKLSAYGDDFGEQAMAFTHCSLRDSVPATLICIGGDTNQMLRLSQEVRFIDSNVVVSVAGDYPWQDIAQIFRPNPIESCDHLFSHHEVLSSLAHLQSFNELTLDYTKRLCGV